MKLLSFGEILFDVYTDGAVIGGAPLNFSAHARRAGAAVELLSAVGEDPLGREALRKIEGYGVVTDKIAILPDLPTGACNVTLDAHGVPRYELLTGVAYDAIPYPALDGDYDALYFGTLALRSVANRETVCRLLACGRFREIFVDINVRLPFCDADSLALALSGATVLKISDEELPYVMKTALSTDAPDPIAALKTLATRFPQLKMIVLTCGARGAVAYDVKTAELFSSDAVKVKVVSTVGAGDSFSATFLVHWLSGKNVNECLQKAAKVSAEVVSQREAIPELSQ